MHFLYLDVSVLFDSIKGKCDAESRVVYALRHRVPDREGCDCDCRRRESRTPFAFDGL